jgi:hypothetical protein
MHATLNKMAGMPIDGFSHTSSLTQTTSILHTTHVVNSRQPGKNAHPRPLNGFVR